MKNHHIPIGSVVPLMVHHNLHIVAAPRQVVGMNIVMYNLNRFEPKQLLFLCFEQLIDIHQQYCYSLKFSTGPRYIS